MKLIEKITAGIAAGFLLFGSYGFYLIKSDEVYDDGKMTYIENIKNLDGSRSGRNTLILKTSSHAYVFKDKIGGHPLLSLFWKGDELEEVKIDGRKYSLKDCTDIEREGVSNIIFMATQMYNSERTKIRKFLDSKRELEEER